MRAMLTYTRGAVLTIVSVVALAGCTGDSSTAVPGPLAELVVVSGDAQEALEGQETPQPIIVEAVRTSGITYWPGSINATITAGGGTISREVGGGSASGIGATLGAVGMGRVTLRWTLGPAGDPHRVRFWIVADNLVDTLSVDVTATSLPSGAGG